MRLEKSEREGGSEALGTTGAPGLGPWGLLPTLKGLDCISSLTGSLRKGFHRVLVG